MWSFAISHLSNVYVECFFLERKACPKDMVNNELYCTMCMEVDAALAPMIDCNFKEVNIQV